MQLATLPTAGVIRRTFAGVATAAVVLLAACGGDDPDNGPVGPNLPGDPPSNPQFRQAAFVFDVNLRRGTVRVTPPDVTLDLSKASLRNGRFPTKVNQGPDFSILGRDAIEISTNGLFASPSGAITPDFRRIYFNVQINNLLPGIDLTTATFPTPPAGQVGVMLIPYETVVTTTSGGTGTEDGNVVVVELPSGGVVLPSIDWNGGASNDTPTFPALPGAGGDPYSFFNDTQCAGTPPAGQVSDCYRYETFGEISGGAISGARRVGFDIESEVQEFRVRMLAVADLRPSGAGATGTVAGQVTSPQRGALAGVTVALQGVAATTTTDASGNYTFANVGLGTRSVTLSTFPAGCSAAGSTPANGSTVAVVGGGTATLDYSIVCSAAAGTINGTVNRTGAGTQSLAGISFVIDPSAAGAANATGTVSGSGATVTFSAATEVGLGVGAGDGSITLGNLPGGCTAPAPAPYTGLTVGGTLAVTISVACDAPPPPPARYAYSSRWANQTATSVDLIITFDPSGFDDPAIAGPDGFSSLQAITNLSGNAAARLTAVTPIATGPFAVPSYNAGAFPPNLAWLTTNAASNSFASIDVATFRFTIAAGAPGTVSTSTTLQSVGTLGGDEFTLIESGAGDNLDITEATLTLP